MVIKYIYVCVYDKKKCGATIIFHFQTHTLHYYPVIDQHCITSPDPESPPPLLVEYSDLELTVFETISESTLFNIELSSFDYFHFIKIKLGFKFLQLLTIEKPG